MATKKWMTVRDAAQELRVSQSTIRNRIKSGALVSRQQPTNGRSVTFVEIAVPGSNARSSRILRRLRQASVFAAGAAVGGIIGNRADDAVLRLLELVLHRGPGTRNAPLWVAETLAHLCHEAALSDVRLANRYANVLSLMGHPARFDILEELVDEVAASDTIDPLWYKSEVGNHVLAQLAGSNMERAIRLSSEIQDEPARSKALRTVAARLVWSDIERAITLASHIALPIERAKILGTIVQVLLTSDLDRAITIARTISPDLWRSESLETIAIKVAEYDIERAVALASEIPPGSINLHAIAKLLGQLSISDPARAISLAETISNDTTRSQALGSIARQVASTDIEQAIELATRMSDDMARDETLRTLAQRLALSDVERAIALANTIAFDLYRSDALATVVKRQVPYDIERAITLARTIPSDWDHYRALEAIATHLAETDLERAIMVLRENASNGNARHLTATLLGRLATQTPQRAVALARMIYTGSELSTALRVVADQVALVDIEGAISLAEDDLLHWGAADLIANWVGRVAKSDPERAIRLTGRVSDAKSRGKAMSAIARELAGADIDRAILLTDTILDDEARAEAMTTTVQHLARHNTDRAVAMTGEIGSHWTWKAIAVLSIASADPSDAITIVDAVEADDLPLGAACFYFLLMAALEANIQIQEPDGGEWVRRGLGHL